jgi:hypothetical protein
MQRLKKIASFTLLGILLKMSESSLTDYIWQNMKSIRFNVNLLHTYYLKNPDDAKKNFKKAIKNVKKRKRYNVRVMGPLLNKINKDLDEVNDIFG